MHRIIVGLDGTDRDHEILEWVGDFAYDTGVHVIAAHFVARSVLWMIAGAQIDSANYLSELRAHFERDVLPALRARIGATHLHVQIGDPAHELAALARRSAADLIAIGAPAHGAVHDMVFGGVERRLVHEASVPLLTIPCGTRHLRPV
jgi:nucleotide-binding universal stress UspA family protein